MDGFAIFLFIVSITLLVISLIIIFTSDRTDLVSATSSGIPLPDSTMIGAQCPVGCTCFPNTAATTPSDKPTQMCAMLNNDVIFSCPPECCQPTCITQDVQEIARRVGN